MKKITAVLFGAVTTVVAALSFGCTKPEKNSVSSDVPAVTKEILVVSFGTSFNNSRNITIGGIESAIRERFPEYKVARAFTADTIINILKERDGIVIDSVDEALQRAVAEGIKTLIVQPTHLMDGFEYNDLQTVVNAYQSKFDSIVLSKPLLSSENDYQAVAKAITEKTASYDDGETAVCFMGHGTEAPSNKAYAKLQNVLVNNGFENYYVGTVEAIPSVDDLVDILNVKGRYSKVVLLPLMVVAGDHANNDMAGDEEDSWKSTFTAAGYSVKCVLEGLGQNSDIQQVYISHVYDAISSLDK